jgi:hypothetical protein
MICHCAHGDHDKTHYELAIAIVEILWIGGLSQMKENRLIANGEMAYSKGTTDNIKRVIIDAFEIDRKYPLEEQRRRHQTIV